MFPILAREVLTVTKRLWILGLVFLCGCKVSHPTSFVTPMDAVLSFQTAFAHGDEVEEYKCFTRSIKQQATLQGYATMHEQLLKPLGSIGRFILARNSLDDNLIGYEIARSRARLEFSLFSREFQIFLEQEPYLSLSVDDTEPPTLCRPRSMTAVFNGDSGALLINSRVSPVFFEEMSSRGLLGVQLSGQWKLADVQPIASEQTLSHSEIPGIDYPTPIAIDRILWRPVGKSNLMFGEFELELPLPPELAQAWQEQQQPTLKGIVSWRGISPALEHRIEP